MDIKKRRLLMLLLGLMVGLMSVACDPVDDDTDTDTNDTDTTDTGSDTSDTDTTDTADSDTLDTDTGLLYEHEGGTIDGGAIWEVGEHTLLGSITITNGTLEVPACSVIKMPEGGRITVGENGGLKLIGLELCPITITSVKPTPAAGDWEFIDFEADSADDNNVFDWVIVEYAGALQYGAVLLESGSSLAMSNSKVHESGHFGMTVNWDSHLRDFTNNTLINNAMGPIEIDPDSVDDLGEGTYQPNGVDAIHLMYGTVQHDSVWLNHDAPYLTADYLTAEAASGSARLTLNAGTTLLVGAGDRITVGTNGGLTLAGTAEENVTITSAKPAPAAGDWEFIDIEGDSIDDYNSFEYAVIEYAGALEYAAVVLESGASLAMSNSTVQESGHLGMTVNWDSHLRDFTNNTIINNARGAMYVDADSVDDLEVGTYTPNNQEGIFIEGTVRHTATWLTHDAPYVAEAGFEVGDSATPESILTVSAGAQILVGAGADIYVYSNGGLHLAGTADDHVTITSAKTAKAPGDWEEINIDGGSSAAANIFDYADISYGGMGAIYGQLWIDDTAGVTLNNTTFSNSGSNLSCDISAWDGATVVADAFSTYISCPD